MAADSSRVAAVAREHGSLAKLATKYRRFKPTRCADRRGLGDAESPDPEPRATGRAELPELKAQREALLGRCWT